MGRWQMIWAYLVLVLTCAAGALRLSVLAAITASTCSLMIISLIADRAASVPPARTVTEPTLLFAHLLNSSAIASAAYIFGHVARWVWGL